uniref:Zinc finger BED domain-containing protein 1-like n=1 Tax=Diabrotica virgifera virgifera TaxID=50390 RepID=A0A6P7GZ57_DIAVI
MSMPTKRNRDISEYASTASSSNTDDTQIPPVTDATQIPSVNESSDVDFDAGPSSKRPKLQQSIKDSFEEIISYATKSCEKAKKIDNAILYFICKDSQPFSVVDNEGFQYLLKVTAPHYKIPSRSTITRWIDDKYDVLSTMLKIKISNVEHVTLTSDIWSDMQMRSFLDVTAHFGVGTEFQSITLGVYPLDERHTSEYIARDLRRTCNDWGFGNDQVSMVVTDNGPNMVRAVEIAFEKRKHLSCFAHTLNLVAQHSLQIEEVQNLIRFLELTNSISDILISNKTAPAMLTGLELNIAASLLDLLRPLEAATKEVSAYKYCTSSK